MSDHTPPPTPLEREPRIELEPSIIDAALDRVLEPVAKLAMLRQQELLRPRDVELLYAYPVNTQNQDRSHGVGPRFVKVGQRVRYRRRDLDRYFDDRIVRTKDQG